MVPSSPTPTSKAEEHLRVFRNAAALLASSLQLEDALAHAVAACLPAIGDFGFFDAVTGDEVRRTVRAHQDPELEALLAPSKWMRQERSDMNLCALSTGMAALHADIDDEWYCKVALNEGHLQMLRQLAFRSMITVPMRYRGELIGSLTLFMARSGRRHDEDDFLLAQEIASLAAPTVVNARFYETQRAAEHALRLSEERLRLATDAGGLGIWDWNIQSDQVTWSHRVYELHRLEPGSFGGRAQDFAALVHPDDLPHVQERIAGALASGGSYRAEFRTVLPGGEIRWLATKANVYLDERGNAARMVGATFDVTERIALLAAERAARAQAESASRAKDEFLAMLGHELRNPLAPIVSALQLMEMRSEGSKRYEHGVIERQVKHLSRLVDDLLDISRITQGKVKLALEQIDILPVIERAIELAAPAMRKKSLDFVAHLPEQPVIVSGDAVRLAQVFGNLLSNAAKFTQQGLIELRATCSGGRLTVDLTDSGTGIPAALLPHVFDMFVQGSQHIDRKMGGLGLGLSIAKTLVDMHGGELRVHSDGPDCGSTFTVELPCIMESSGVPHHEKTAELPRSSARVMIVDDNADAGETMAELLKMAGCEVCCLTSALQAIGTADTFKPAVAVLDIGLPEMDGYELARRLKARLPGIRLIALTGYGREPDKARALAADFDRHLVKPAAVGDLLSAIRELTLTGAV